MAIAFVGSSQLVSGSLNPDGSVTRPTGGTTEGNVLVYGIALDASNRDITPPSGWVEIEVEDPDSLFNSEYTAWYHVVGASAPSSDLWGGEDTPIVFTMACYSGCHATTPVEASAIASGTNIPSATSGGAGRMLVGFAFGDGGTGWTADAAMTEREDLIGGGTAGGDMQLSDEAVGSGATGTRTPSFDGTMRTGIAVILRPLGGGPSVPVITHNLRIMMQG